MNNTMLFAGQQSEQNPPTKVGGAERHGRAARGKLGGGFPRTIADPECHFDGTRVEAPRPHERRRYVEMGMSFVDLRVRAVGPVREQGVGGLDRSVVAGDAP